VLPESGSGKRTVAFSLLSPSGERKNPARLGMQVQVVPLEFRSLFDRLMQTKQYDGCVAGLASFDADPNSYIKVWLSSRPTHFWNPSQAHPARPW
jgi:ABC-type oligopeptide transport system substrate-binding subunit